MEVRAGRLSGRRSTGHVVGDLQTPQSRHSPSEERCEGGSLEQLVSVSGRGHSRTLSWDGTRSAGRGVVHVSRGMIGQNKSDSLGSRTLDLRFIGTTVSELRMSEIPALLAEHQRLARLCEELLAERTDMLGARRRRS